MLIVTLIFCSVFVFYFVVGCVSRCYDRDSYSLPLSFQAEFAGICTGYTMFFTMPFWGLYLMDSFGML